MQYCMKVLIAINSPMQNCTKVLLANNSSMQNCMKVSRASNSNNPFHGSVFFIQKVYRTANYNSLTIVAFLSGPTDIMVIGMFMYCSMKAI